MIMFLASGFARLVNWRRAARLARPAQPEGCGYIMMFRMEGCGYAARPALRMFGTACCALGLAAAENVSIEDVPDYHWHAGCFGTAAGNLMGYWDRNGLPDFYTGPTGGGVAPLDSFGNRAGIQSMWASRAGFDGRPASRPGHLEDYWEDPVNLSSFESTGPDPYTVAGRAEHAPDCIGDFIGQSQSKWPDLNGECSGNIDGYAFNFWNAEGERHVNYQPQSAGVDTPDLQSGFRAWARSRGYEAEVASQLVDTNPTVPDGKGFSFADLKAEIDGGFPVYLVLQHSGELSRSLPGNSRANPGMHAMVADGYIVTDGGAGAVRYRTSWAEGSRYTLWDSSIWEAGLPLRGVITFRPKPKLAGIARSNGMLTITWHGPHTVVRDALAGMDRAAHWYVVERSNELTGLAWATATAPTSDLSAQVIEESTGRAFYRVRMLSAEEAGRR